MDSLTRVHAGCYIGDQGLVDIAPHIAKCTSLESLSLRCEPVLRVVFREIHAYDSIADNKLTTIAPLAAALRSCPNLTKLHIHSTQY